MQNIQQDRDGYELMVVVFSRFFPFWDTGRGCLDNEASMAYLDFIRHF